MKCCGDGELPRRRKRKLRSVTRIPLLSETVIRFEGNIVPLNYGRKERGIFFMKNCYSPFSKSFWKDSAETFKSLRLIAFSALFIALGTVVKSLFIPLPVMGEQRIMFAFLVYGIGAMVYGPFMGAAVGIISDIVGCILFPSGTYFFGYTVTAAVGGFLYGLFLYRRDISVPRFVCCKLTVNILANVVLNSVWSTILAGGDFNVFGAMALARLPKNLIMLPLETVMFVLLARTVVPILRRVGYLPSFVKSEISWKL